MGAALNRVARRIEREVGLSRTMSRRIAYKLNEMAKRVSWATPVEGAPARNHRRSTKARKAKKAA